MKRVGEETSDTMTDGRLAGHSVLVTGASSGIGLGIARKMAEEGAAVGTNYRSHQAPAEKLAPEIRAWGGKAVAIGADVSKEPEVHRLFEETVSAFGQGGNGEAAGADPLGPILCSPAFAMRFSKDLTAFEGADG